MNLESIRNQTAGMIMKFAIPSIIAMVLTSLITVVDGYFIGNYVGEEGIAALNLGLPILYVFLAVGIMIGVGGVAIAGIQLGAGERDRSNGVFNQTAVTSLIASVLLSVFVLILFQPIVNALKMDQEVASCFRSYYRIMLFTYPFMMLNISLGMFIRSEGKPEAFMQINVVSVVMNIVLDYVFIDRLNLGIEGIALASLISVVVGSLFMAYYFLKRSVVFRFKKFVFSKEVFRSTVFNGSSELIGQLSMSITMLAYNYVVLKIEGVNGVAAFSVIGYAAYLFSMIVIGFGQGASPLISFSFGAKEPSLCHKIRRMTNLYVFIAGLIAMLLLILFSDVYSNAFVKDEDVSDLIRTGIIVFVISFLFSGINTINSFYFTSIARAKESAIISASRGLVVILLCIFVLPLFFGITGIWLVAPVTEGITILIGFLLIKRHLGMVNELKVVENAP